MVVSVYYSYIYIKHGNAFLTNCYLLTFDLTRDGSVVYGNNTEGMVRVRTFLDGKLKIAGDGLLEHDTNGVPVSGDVRNGWAGFSLLQALFVKEHNAVCDMLKVSFTNLYIRYIHGETKIFTIYK